MALQQEKTVMLYGEEIKFNEAYHQIDGVNGSKLNIEITVVVYKNAQKEIHIENRMYQFKPSVADDAPNYHKQGYEYLKTLPEFAGAVDC